jgi:uncharacterized membrane protein YphA (DoxX/SURF4 family)
MLNPFPIQWLALFAYLLLRVCAGAVLLLLGIRHLGYHKELAQRLTLPIFPFNRISIALLILTELVSAVSLLLGFYTQIGALLMVILAVKCLLLNNRFNHPSIPPRMVYILLIGIGLSLFITGGGALAFDLPI